MDDVAYQISIHNQQLITLDMWKAHFLSANGLMALSNCHHLEEVDLGWWSVKIYYFQFIDNI